MTLFPSLRRRARSACFLTIAAIVFGAASPLAAQQEPPAKEKGRTKMASSPLERAIERGMRADGDLSDELLELGDYTIRSREDGEAVCAALRKLPAEPTKEKGFRSRLSALTSLFQDVDGRDAPAFEVLYDDGQRELLRLFDARIESAKDDDADDLLIVLKVLAMYGSREGAERVVAAAEKPLKPDAYLWHVVLSIFSEGHPQAEYVFESLSDPLPPGFLAVSLLDAVNGAAIAGELEKHPFDSPAGRKWLQDRLEDRDAEHFSYAHSATAALPFIGNPDRDRLLALALDHVDASVQMEGAWAAAKVGREAGLKMLARYCLDVNHSDAARRYLKELEREDLVPAAADEPTFRAKADFAQWLAHPNELGEPPDALEIVDQRSLAWPPEREPQPFYLIRFMKRDDTGLSTDKVDAGLVGSMTWCFFSYHMHERPPEDAYAIHCYWEMKNADLIAETEATDPAEFAGLLSQWRGAALQEPRVVLVAEPSAELKYPGRLVGLAEAKLDGREGWVALDGPRSAWYPRDEQPADASSNWVMMIHVGRQLLGFQEQPERKKYLVGPPATRPPQQIVAVYEKLLAEAATAKPKRQQELLQGGGLLFRYFDDYLDAASATSGKARAEVFVGLFEKCLQTAERADPTIREDVVGSIGLLGEHFEAYVDALSSSGRNAEVESQIARLEPYWQNNLGYTRLGAAAFRIGRRDVAEKFFVKFREGAPEHYHRNEYMSSLAEIWHGRGETERARELLLACLREMVKEIEKSKYVEDRKTFIGEFRHHRATYLRLFPGGEKDLADRGLPSDFE